MRPLLLLVVLACAGYAAAQTNRCYKVTIGIPDVNGLGTGACGGVRFPEIFTGDYRVCAANQGEADAYIASKIALWSNYPQSVLNERAQAQCAAATYTGNAAGKTVVPVNSWSGWDVNPNWICVREAALWSQCESAGSVCGAPLKECCASCVATFREWHCQYSPDSVVEAACNARCPAPTMVFDPSLGKSVSVASACVGPNYVPPPSTGFFGKPSGSSAYINGPQFSYVDGSGLCYNFNMWKFSKPASATVPTQKGYLVNFRCSDRGYSKVYWKSLNLRVGNFEGIAWKK